MTPSATFLWSVVGAALGTALPLGLLLWWRRTHRAKWTPFFVGALVFVVFALVLEPLAHRFFLLGDHAVARAIGANPYLYMLYGGLAAGVFEETGRFVAFRFLLTKRRFPERTTAVAYGIGHGGVEALLLHAAPYLLCAVLAIYQSRGNAPAALALAGGNAEALAALYATLAALTPGAVLLGLLERAGAMLLHVALSCFVFLAARDRTQRAWFPFAIALHAIADMPAALCQRGLLPLGAVELWLWVVALFALLSARKCYLEAMDP
ncbi:MAG: YhfC family intramembrane metalloprotease [Oscillospiraceae bacterium]|nr:YhfC family intramembrane metalloprotease [Oscillospiraceae bacterium]